MNIEVKKRCPYCDEEIKALAKICHHCQQWLSLLSLRNPLVSATIVGICVFIVPFTLLLCGIHRFTNQGVNFSPYRDRILVIESEMNKRTEFTNGAPKIDVVGLITNETDLSWKQVQFDFRFFDKSGALIDARSWSYYDNKVLSHGDMGFKFSLDPVRPFADYSSYKVFVAAARDLRAFP